MTTIRVVVAEDMRVLREALIGLLALEDDITVVGESERGDHAVELVRSLRPDVVVLDIDLPGVDGLEVARRVGEHVPSCRTLVLSALDRPGVVLEAVAAGVKGFLPKGVSFHALTAAVRTVHSGRTAISPALLADAKRNGRNPLTGRELEVLRAVATGATAADVSRRLYMSVGTARNHMTRVLGKLGVRNRVEAIRAAEEAGWLSLPGEVDH